MFARKDWAAVSPAPDDSKCPQTLSGTGPEPKARKSAPAGRGFGWPSRHGLSSARAMFLLSIATSRRVGFSASMMPDDGPDPGRPAPRNCFQFAEIDTGLTGPSGAPWGGIIRARIFEAGPVQEKCEGVSSYGLWGLCARLCARMLSLERMLASARFADTAQLGRVCKKSVRPPGRGVQGGSLSKKLRLNRPQTCVRKVFARFPCPWPHFQGHGPPF